MKRHISLALTVLVVAGVAVMGVAAQQPATPRRDVTFTPVITEQSQVAPGIKAPAIETKLADQTAEQLVERVKSIRAQKAELNKQEAELMTALANKVEKLKAELNMLNGVANPVPPEAPGVPPVPGRP